MEPHKHDELRYFPIGQLPPKEESHSMLYPALYDFKDKIESITGEKVILN